ncbi:hypothetical protein [Paenimyroides baculatum]|uniref:Antitoxin component YwqK of the YwqJK toxin-antitoxin module n=1 Tax=Paenimyroides baculatum TaxID=2608000 RepID=A0A5M6CLE6_9FLAO|nr:hypothetical protein [Paenimyroides baculatum]KAA5535883.1 hypothetical protein F0460_05445 [Paenimyroides baculatum]
MNIFNNKLLLATTVFLYVNLVFSQHKNIDTLQLVIPKDYLEAFTYKVEIAEYNAYFYNEVILASGSYKIRNKSQEADFIIENNLISGTVTTYENFKKGQHKEGDNFKTEYKLNKSLVTEYTMFADDKLFLKAYRKDNQIFGKEFHKTGEVQNESQLSVAPDKTYGLSITKSYDRDGKIYQINDEITETYTQFYPNGKKKSVMGKTETTYYDENEVITRKANFKVPPFYDDEFVNGRLHSRSYKNDENEEVKEFFKNGVLERKEITKIINGEQITFVYDKSGKLIDKYPYQIENQKILGTISGGKTVATAVENQAPLTEIAIEAEIISANFSGGNEAYRKFITDNFDTSATESDGLIKLELDLTIDADGTASLENKQQKIYSDKYLADEMNRVLKKSPKWNPATQNGIPVKSSVRFPVKINIQ